MAVIFIAIGIPLYMVSRHEQGARFFFETRKETTPFIFSDAEKALCIIIIATALVAIYAFSHGIISL